MIVELISVGTELLLGNIVNTNAAYLSEKCALLGLSCFYQSVVGDNEDRLIQALETARERADIIILSGGLGPTKDDLTKETVAKVCKREMYLDTASKENIERIFNKRNLEITNNNWKQALIPEGALVVFNENGTAPGIILEDGSNKFILLPGPPNELLPMFEKSIKPYLESLEPGIIFSETVKICGIGESKAETMIEDLMDNQTNPTIAPYAKTGEVHLRVTAKAENEKQAKELIEPMVLELKNRFGKYIYTTNESVSLEQAVVELLMEKNLTLAVSESCTGGLFSGRIMNVPGASKVYQSGYITYSNQAKSKILGIDSGLIEQYGAVSEETALEMAKQTALVAETDVAVGITGIAGPDGGTPNKPVGLVYIACSVCGNLSVKEYKLNGNRAKIRENTVSQALTQLRFSILEHFNK